MKLIHTADWHLGFRQFGKLTPDGLNVRERDVAVTFRRMIDQFITIAPDVIVVAGDIFHTVRPTNLAIVHMNKQLRRLYAALPNVIVVMVAGNHDSPKSSDTGSILPLYRELGVHVVERGHTALRFGELSILAVPDHIGIQRPALEPDPTAKYNVLLMHGEVEGMPRRRGQRVGVDEIKSKTIGIDAWDVIALGHYHCYTELAPNMMYSGSIDFTSTDPWSEIETPKGFVVWDLATRTHKFAHNPPSRAWFSFPPIELTNPTTADVDAAIASAVESIGGVDDKVVRLVITGVPRETQRAINHAVIREHKRTAAAFQLQMEEPEYVESALSMEIRGVTEPGGRSAPLDAMGYPIARPRTLKSLRELVVDKLAEVEVPADINRDELMTRGLAYLDQAAEKDADAPPSDVEGTIAPAKKRPRAKEVA